MKRLWIAAACAALSSAALAGPAWITLGDDAHALLARVAPEAQTLSSRVVPVMVPAAPRSRELIAGRETVHAVQVDEDALSALSEAVHESLRRCGGFVRHDSLAEALAVLHRLGREQVTTLAPSYAVDDTATVNALLPQMQASNILATIQSLSDFQNRYYTSQSGVQSSDWLANHWRTLAAGRSDVTVTQVRHLGWPQKSVQLTIRGTTKPSEIVVLGGHLDSIASGGATARAPGADDDASGIASLTEVIRVLLANDFRPTRTIEFYGYAAEEVGLRGSQQIATKSDRQGRNIVGVMQLDMTAYQGDAQDIWLYTDYTNAAQNQFVANLVAAYQPQLTVGFDRCGYACSDHASWHGRGFAASFPFESSFSNYNHAIHTQNDTIATFGGTADHALKFSQLALAYAVELGSD
jgi:bacterial leucyl aminopeptidase